MKKQGGRKKGGGKSGGFQSMQISKDIFKGIMRLGYKVPTPIQRKALPLALQGKDIVAMARTGSGKTCAFLVPLLDKLQSHSTEYGVRGVVLSPTRELAIQTLKFAKGLAKFTDLRFALLVGGDSMETQFSALASNPDIIVATPGRLMHQLLEVPDFKMTKVEVVIFDEADRLFEMGFAEQLREIVKDMPEQRQTLLFSATLPQGLISFARAGLKAPAVIRLDAETKISDQLKLGFITVRSPDKLAAFMLVMRELIPTDTQQTIVFVATRHHVDLVHAMLKKAGIPSAYVYGQMDQVARHENIDKFRAKKLMVMVVTDVAARGIDIPLLDNVVNLHFPAVPKLFVHRVGRAARAGRSGVALSIVGPDEVAYLMDLDLFLGKGLKPANASGAGAGGTAAATTIAKAAAADAVMMATAAAAAAAKPYSLASMTTADVHFGTMPQAVLDAEVEHVSQMLDASSDMKALVKVCGRGYKQYVRTRSEPSHRSIARGKAVMRYCFLGTCIHPLWLAQDSSGGGGGAGCGSGVGAGDAGGDDNGSGSGSASSSASAFAQAAAAKEAYLSQLRTFRPKETVLELREAKASASLYVTGGFDGVGQGKTVAQVMHEKRAEHQAVIARHAYQQELQQQQHEQQLREEEEEEEEDEYNENELANTQGAGMNEVAGAAGAQSSSSSTSSAGIKRMSAAERRKLKKKRRAKGQPFAENGNNDSGSSSMPMNGAKKKKKAGADSVRSKHYITHDITAQQEFADARYGDSEDSRTATALSRNLLEGALLDVVPDEAVAMMDKKRVQRWDRKKKKFVQTTVGEMRRGETKTRMENGKVVVGGKRKAALQGKAYAKWAFKSKQAIGVSEMSAEVQAGLAATMGQGGGEGGDGAGGQGPLVVDGGKADYRRGAKQARYLASLKGITHGASAGLMGGDGGTAGANTDAADELKSEDVIRKEAAMSKHTSDMNKGRTHMKALSRKSKKERMKKRNKGNFGTKGKVKMIIRPGKGKGGKRR